MITGLAGVTITVPLTATFWVVVPVDATLIFPVLVPVAVLVNRTNIAVVVTVPLVGVKLTLAAKPAPDVVDTSKPDGGVTNKLAVKPLPATVKLC